MFKHEHPINQVVPEFELDGSDLTLSQLERLNQKGSRIATKLGSPVIDRMMQSVRVVEESLDAKQVVYGVTTGFGGMSGTLVDCVEAGSLQENLITFLAAGAGPEIESVHTRSAMLLRANVLMQGCSGIRPKIIEQILRYYDSGAVPIVRELGSIGASGDLIPLSTLARAVTGVGGRVAVRIGAEKYNSSQALKKIGLKPIPLQAKEGLALINGTSFSCAIAANATIAAKQLLSVSMVVQAILMTALKVDLNPFQSFVHDCKPHPGQAWAAKVIRDLVHPVSGQHAAGEMVQDRYSIRCFPQYCAPIVEGIARVGRTIQTEMNSISDNPLIHNSEKRYYQSGNFLGQYIGIAMDDLRRMIGLLAKHLDVQIASLVAPEFNKGLSASLVGNSKHAYNMGLKGLQICGNSIMPMLTYMGNPIVEHFPTHAEQFNQNINSMSWGAANLAWNSIKMFRQYLAVSSLFAVQAIDLRAKSELGHFGGHELLRGTCRSFYESVCQLLDVECQNQRPYLFDDVDRWLEQDVDVVANDLAVKDKLIPSVGSVSHEFAEFCGANL